MSVVLAVLLWIGPCSEICGQRSSSVAFLPSRLQVRERPAKTAGPVDLTSFGALTYPGFFSTDELRHQLRLREAKKIVSRIRHGFTRADVRLILPIEDGGLSGPEATRYYFDHEVMIEVPYDRTGGNWSANNRVTGQIRIYRSLRALD